MPRQRSRVERVEGTVHSKGVKLHRFLPSGRVVWTVSGREGDQLVIDEQPYCSCRDFYFRGFGERGGVCYHIEALRLAKRLNRYETIELQDEEGYQFMKALLDDLTLQMGATMQDRDGQ